MCGHDQLLQPPAAHSSRSSRRRSADIGGLSLATRSGGLGGQGWLGHGSGEQIQTRFAELLSDMYTQTLNAVNEHTAACASPDLPLETRVRLIGLLDGWNFEPSTLPDEDHVAACAVLFFEALFRIEGMREAVGLELEQIPPFIQHLRHIYRWQNSYHNFEHALDVLQATYCYLRAAKMVPPLSILLPENEDTTWVPERAFDSGPLITVLSREDLFVLAIAAIGHDVGHPGFTNLFMANAAAPLRRLRRPEPAGAAAFNKLDSPNPNSTGKASLKRDGKSIRRLLSDIVLATDMRVHEAFMKRFAELVSAGGAEEKSLADRRTTLCQAIIKCADISNPSRPYYISKHWAALLLREWNAQAALERHHHLPPTVEASDHPLREASSQMFFIPAFVKPLLDLVVRGVPEMQPYAEQCDLNLALWTARLAILKAAGDASNAASQRTQDKKEKDQTTPKKTCQPRQPSDNEDDADATAKTGDDTNNDEEDPCPMYDGAFPLALPPARFIGHGHFSWTGTASSLASPASPRVPPSSRPPSRFATVPPPQARATPPSSFGTTRRDRAPSSFSSEGEGEGDADGESASEASFMAFSPTASSRGSSTTSASPGAAGNEHEHENIASVLRLPGHGNDNGNGNDSQSECNENGSEPSEYETAWNGSESGASVSGRGSVAGWAGGSGSRAGSVRSVSGYGLGLGDEVVDGVDGGTAAIRAAARLAGLKPFGSLRHAPHRNSWSPAMRDEWVAQMSASAACPIPVLEVGAGAGALAAAEFDTLAGSWADGWMGETRESTSGQAWFASLARGQHHPALRCVARALVRVDRLHRVGSHPAKSEKPENRNARLRPPKTPRTTERPETH
ncbi:High-affinity phosphodiesterase [Mycena venus]|uniref:Phosphodiesterase n=1 Tax=Mycena venus TaxID=2733690 RepID=A0A8H6YL10_9AGAR|nr:High-affinity phosphodiesterase [Mycena venus]